jgi:hypothetical protein
VHKSSAFRSNLTSAKGIPVALATPAIIAGVEVESCNLEFSINPIDTLADTHTKTFSELEGCTVGLLVVGTAVG